MEFTNNFYKKRYNDGSKLVVNDKHIILISINKTKIKTRDNPTLIHIYP